MALHFSPAEFERRKTAVLAAMERERLDGLLLFQQESMYWLTGYDTFGFCFFQCLVVTANGRVALLTRSADLRQARHTSNIADIRIWKDAADANPALDLKALAGEMGLQGKRLGVELESYGLVAANGNKLEAAFDGFATLVDASHLITRLRAVKSGEEIAYVRRAAELANEADAAALAQIRAGANEGDILAAQHAAIFRGGGDYPGNEFIIGSGADALLCRYKAGRRRLDTRDQITLEFAGVYRHYHAAIMRTVVVGDPKPARRSLPARRSSSPAARRATSSRPTPACSTRMGLRSTASTPAATRSARNSPPPGWTGRCSTRPIPGRSSPAWCSSPT
jgi:Xaa-Pro dipeptidase